MKAVKVVATIFVAIVVFYLLAKSCYIQRGYWAIGGEIFVPMAIIGAGLYSIIRGGKYED